MQSSRHTLCAVTVAGWVSYLAGQLRHAEHACYFGWDGAF
jgi:hypothetical protein